MVVEMDVVEKEAQAMFNAKFVTSLDMILLYVNFIFPLLVQELVFMLPGHD